MTFTGTEQIPGLKIPDGPQSYPLPVTRTDGFGVATIDFAIETGILGGITALNDDTITSLVGTSSTVITITDQQIDPFGNITINIGDIQEYVANRPFTRDNVIVEDTSDDANWTWVVERRHSNAHINRWCNSSRRNSNRDLHRRNKSLGC